jgi:hypothetical protein
MDRGGLTGLAEVSSIDHDPCLHELPDLSNTIIVLVFSELPSFVRKILQREENKGVELTGDGNIDEEEEVHSRQLKVEKSPMRGTRSEESRDGEQEK